MPETTSSVRNFQQAYIDHGYFLFDCANSKKPIEEWGHAKCDYDPDQDVSSLALMYGVRLNDDDLVIDFDPRRCEAGINELEALWRILGVKLPETFIVETAGDLVHEMRGCHIYLKKPADLEIARSVNGLKSIEIKSRGQYVIGAYSYRKSKKRHYEVKSGWIGEVANAPVKLLEFLQAVNGKYSGDTIVDDSQGTQDRFIAYLLHEADLSIKGAGGNNTAFLVAQRGRSYGLSEHVSWSLMCQYWNPRCEPNWAEEKLARVVANAYRYAQDPAGAKSGLNDFNDVKPDKPVRKLRFDWTKTDGIKEFKKTLRNTCNFFYGGIDDQPNELEDLLRFNEFSQKVEFKKKAPWHTNYNVGLHWEDNDTIMCKDYMVERFSFESTNTYIEEASLVVAKQNESYHPLLDYLESLKWDGKKRVDNMLHAYAGCLDSKYNRAVGACMMLSAVARIYKPGCQQDHMLVLEGDQGTGKTNFIRTLGGRFYADVPIDVATSSARKDTVQKMVGKWILEASEMDFTRRQEVTAVKSFLTITVDRERLSYGRQALDLHRQSIWIGSVNPGKSGKYLTDEQNRRFWPVTTHKFDIETMAKDRDQLWAEAIVRFKNGEQWWITDHELVAMVVGEQAIRVQTNGWSDIVMEWFRLKGDEVPHVVTTDLIAYEAFDIRPGQLTRQLVSKLNTAIREAGYEEKFKYCPVRKRSVRSWEFEEFY